LNPIISEMLKHGNTKDPWHAPIALSLYQYLRGTFITDATRNDFISKHVGTMAKLSQQSLEAATKRLLNMLQAWYDADIIYNSKVNKDLRFTEKYQEIANNSTTPMTSEPNEWSTEFGGNGTRTLCGGRPLKFISDKQIEALEVMQSTPFKINTKVLLFAQEHFSSFGKESFSERRAIEWATEHSTADYWLPLFLDWRGRIYTDSGAICSYQGADLHRALCDFGDKYYVDPNSAEYKHFLKSIEAEYGVTEDNYLDIISKFQPSKYKSKEKVWCRLRAAIAINEIKLTNYTGYILQQDATCSGMGHMACIMHDRKLAEKCALLGPIDKDADLYSITANTAISTPRYFTFKEQECDFNISELLKLPQVQAELGNRSQAKKTVMVTAYGSSVVGNATGWAEDSGAKLDEDLKPVEALCKLTWEDCPNWHDTGFIQTVTAAMEQNMSPAQVFLCLANAYSRALDKHFPSIQQFIGHMRKIAQKTHNITGFATLWKSSSGMTCFKQHVTEREEKRTVKLDNSKRTVVPTHKTEHGAAGHAPNRIHSEDVALVTDTAIVAADEGIPIACIHDSWGSKITDALRMRQIVRDSMVKLHSNYLFADEEAIAGVPPISSDLKWDLNEMSDAMIGV
jgi:DNA-directed RNA polymerase